MGDGQLQQGMAPVHDLNDHVHTLDIGGQVPLTQVNAQVYANADGSRFYVDVSPDGARTPTFLDANGVENANIEVLYGQFRESNGEHLEFTNTQNNDVLRLDKLVENGPS